jgi:hypothetical protein
MSSRSRNAYFEQKGMRLIDDPNSLRNKCFTEPL